MPTPFSEWNLEDAKLAAQLSKDEAKRIAAYRAFYEGDHWQNWDAWTGPKPDPNDPDYALYMAEIPRGFVSRGVIREAIDRHVNGVLGRDVKFTVTVDHKLDEGEQPEPEEQALIDEAQNALDRWVEDRKLNQEYDTVGATLGYAGVAYQRVFVAPGEVDLENGTIPNSDLATSMGRVYVQFPPPGEAVVYTDPRTQRKCGIYLYRHVEGDRPSETQGKEGDERAELTYLDGDQTVIRIVDKNGTVGADPEKGVTGAFPYPLGNRLFISAMKRPALINDQVISQQKLLNKTLTMKGRNMDMRGFGERAVINAQMGGSYQEDENGKRVFVPHKIPVGPGVMQNINGYMLTDKDGNQTLTTPSIEWADPVSVESFLDTERSCYLNILAECNQLHYAMSDDATASGTSRETAMSAYLIDLLQTKQQIDTGWSHALETVLALGAVLSGQPNRFEGLRVSAECAVDPGPISSEMMKVVIELVRETLLSRHTGMGWIGVEDIDAEEAQIAKEIEERMALFPETTQDEQAFGQDLDREVAEMEA